MSTRKKNRALVYLRRSGKRQETSLTTQLDWAVREAKQLGVRLEVTLADLAHMRETRICTYKSLRLDDGVSGSDQERPGFLALNRDAIADRSVSHVLIFRRDRYSRPEDSVDAVQNEKRLLRAGITLVFSTKSVSPGQRGQRDLAKDIDALLEYNESGAFCDQLAERMILTHQALAAEGFSTGGNPPFGHVRGLFNADGKLVEILPKGRTVRQEGLHVRWIPGDDEESRAKIKIWIHILALSEVGWGGKRIAAYLNNLGIPSPGAGTVRTDNGVPHKVSGKWCANTVLDLIRNSTIAAQKTYGVRAEGKHRRLGENGWRYLEEDDRTISDDPKVIRNPEDLIVRAPSGADPSFEPGRLARIQTQLRERGRNQRGIPRAKDPAKYPLSGRVH